jgi:hypothetical protein
VQFINNVFMGSGDDFLDLDNTDAWVEGNIFLHAHKNGPPDTSSAVSGGSDTGESSDVTIIGNLIYDCDHAANAKQGNFFTFLNNTIVRQSHQGGLDTEGALLCLADNNMSEGAGMYLEGNIIYDAEKLLRNRTNAVITFTNNIIHLLQGAPWTGPGGGNSTNDPLFKYVPQVAETTNFTSWAQAQVMWDWFSLNAGSPARGSGPNGRDKGGVIPLGVSIAGEPAGATPLNSATLYIGLNRTGSSIPTNATAFPNGTGYTHYQWRLDGGVWSAETPVPTPISLTGLGLGPHYVEVVGKRDSGLYQDDPLLGPAAVVTMSRTWTVDPTASLLRLNEILASNDRAVIYQNTTPDLIELYNGSTESLDLGGVRLTDDPQDPDKFIFPLNATIGPGEYLVVYANNPDGTPGYHLGFNLNQQGDAVYLYDKPERGGTLLDSITFGSQITDLSIGRLADGSWALTLPTFGAPNQAAPLGDPARLRINEWLAIGETPFANDFIELLNSDPRPVSLGGLYLSDEILGWPDRHQIAALSFISGYGYLRLFADGAPAEGPDHLNFRLSGDQGDIGLYGSNLAPIDLVMYQAQRLNVSQGRSPNGSSTIVYFDQPTPGAPNPVQVTIPSGGALVINELLANNKHLLEAPGWTPDWIELYNGATNTIQLGGYSLSDDVQEPRRYVFAAGAQIGAGRRLRLFCDGNLPVSTNNTGFGLKAAGGNVYLFDAPTNGPLSTVTYGIQAADLSVGRVPDGSTNWVLTSPTPELANVAVPTLGNAANLKINEWMASQTGGDDWFELYNPNPQPVALGGFYLTDDLNDRLNHQIAPLSFIGAGTNAWQKFVADNNTGAGADHVGFALKVTGEAIGLSTPNGTLIDGVVFGVQQADLSEGRFPDGGTNIVSFPRTASPGEPNYRWLTEVVINEALTHASAPLEDAIELRNLTANAIDISGWWLSDDNAAPKKYQIPFGTVLPANGFVTFYENQFANQEFAAMPFALGFQDNDNRSRGDGVVLSAATNNTLTGYRTLVKFGPAYAGVSFGRYVTSVGEEQFVALSARTFGMDDPASVDQFRQGAGATNAYPKVGPVVISEIMYHPAAVDANDNVRDEYLELHNITTAPVPLYDPAYPTNVWHLRDAVDFEFPPGTVIPPSDYLLVVSFDPINDPTTLAAFRNKYRITSGVLIVGPYRGKLANDTDEIELRCPGTPVTNDVPYILVDRVRYADRAPWPALADGNGLSLHRVNEQAFGNDPANWTAAAPTPGPMAAPLDYDDDGMLDAWELAHGLDPYNPWDANMDYDGDGLSNRQEYQIGTDPLDRRSVLRFEAVGSAANRTNLTFSFVAISNQTYTIEYSDNLINWNRTANFNAAPTNRIIQVESPLNATNRFFRLRAPALP